jgi:hypothetical protein
MELAKSRYRSMICDLDVRLKLGFYEIENALQPLRIKRVRRARAKS